MPSQDATPAADAAPLVGSSTMTATPAAARTARFPSGLSPSQMNVWDQCQRRWAFEKVWRMPSPPGEPALLGTHVHRVLEVLMALPGPQRTRERAHAIHQTILQKLLDATSAVDAGAPHTDVAPADDEDYGHLRDWLVLRPDPATFTSGALAGLDGYFAMGNPAAVDVVALEARGSDTWTTTHGDVPVRGMIDRVDRIPAAFGGGLAVRDYKNGRPANPKFDRGEHDRQILFYAALAERLYDELPRTGMLIYVTHRVPKRVEVTPDRVAEVKEQAGKMWATAKQRLDDDSYEPSPGPLCGWCPHLAHCTEGQGEVRRRIGNGTGKGGMKVDAPGRAIVAELDAA